jgi:thioredoxin-like negative regulator of GroEL
MQPEWRPSSQPLDASSLPEALARHPVVLLHFWAAWNRVDRLFDEQLQAVRDEFAGRIFFGAIDADDPEQQEFIRRCQVGNLPAFACFIRGERAGTVVGSRPAAELRERFAGWLDEAGRTPNLALQRTPAATALLGIIRAVLGGRVR